MAHPQPPHGPVVQPQGLPQHAQVQQTQPPVVVLNAQPPSMTLGWSSKKGSMVCLASTQLAWGAACIFFNFIGCFVGSDLTEYVGQGFWCGLIFILAGAFGVAYGRQEKQALIVACLVLSVISACLSPVLIFLAVIVFIWSPGDNGGALAVTMNLLLVLFGVLEGIIAIATSALCCSVLCREPGSGTTEPGRVQFIRTPGGQTLMIQQPHPSQVPQEPPATYPVTAPYGRNPQQYNAPQTPPYTIEPSPPYKQDTAPVHQQLQQSGAP